MRIPNPAPRYALPGVLLLAVTAVLLFAGCGDDDSTTPDDDQNRAPVIDSLSVDILVVTPADTVDVRCFARDLDGDTLQFAWLPEDGVLSGSGSQVRWVAPVGDGTHSIMVTVTDGQGGSARDTVTVDVLAGTLLLQTRDGVTAVDALGRSFILNPSTSSNEVLGTRIFLKGNRSIQEIDHQGQMVRDIEISGATIWGHDFVMLPDGGFIFASNGSDSVHFMSDSGEYLGSTGMPNPSENSLQNIDGVVSGDRVIISDNGNNDLVAFDLDTHAGSVFRSFPDWGGWLGAIDHADGVYYLCGGQAIRSFTEAGEPRDITTLAEGNITGIVVVGSYAYVVVNFEGTLHRVDVRTGEDEILLDGLDYPQDVEYLPVALAPPEEP